MPASVARSRELVLMLLSVASGVLDAISFIVFGKVFTAFMTGNLVFLGLGAAHAFHPGGPDMGRVCIVLVAFSVGVYLTARLIRRVRRTTGHNGLAASLVAIVAVELVFLAGWLVVGGEPSSASATLLAAIGAIAMGMQSSAVGSLDVKGVFTTAATASLINLSREAADRRVSDTDPARMIRVLVCLVLGAFAGGLLLVHARAAAAVLPPVLTALALAVTLAGHRPSSETVAPTTNGAGPVDPATVKSARVARPSGTA